MTPRAAILVAAGVVGGAVIGLLGGPIGAIIGAIAGAATGGGAAAALGHQRPAAARQGRSRKERVDPFTVAEPWRRLSQDALGAKRVFNEAVGRTRPGPLRDRLGDLGRRIDETVDEAWAAAKAGDAVARAYSRLDVPATRRRLDIARASGSSAGDAATVAALESQMATAERLERTIVATEDRLRVLNARLDESVAQSIELSVGLYQPDAFSEIEGDVVSITDELEALRAALEDTSGPRLPVLPNPTSSAPETGAATDSASPAEGRSTPRPDEDPGATGVTRPQGQ